MKQKWTPNGTKMDPKTGQKTIQKYDVCLIDFEAVLEPGTVGQPPENERAGAVEGGRGEA